MAGVADEVEAALAAAHLDELEEREEDFQAHDAGVSLDDLDAVKEAIRKQVEFYFSDANLPTDKHLIKQIQKDPEGFVPIKVLANFKRVKALSKDLDVVVAALAASPLLQVQADTKRVRRLAALPEVDTTDIERRTVLVEHLPTTPTIESVTQLFTKHGEVRMVRICAQGSKHKLPAWLTTAVAKMVVGSQQYALVEFGTEEDAVKAVNAYKDLDNWRTSLRVRHLRAPKQGSRPSSRSEHHSTSGHRLSDGRGHGGHSSSGHGSHPKSNSSSRRGSHDGAHKGDDLPSLPPVRTSMDGRPRHAQHHSHLGHGEGHAAAAAAAASAISGGGGRPLSPYSSSNRGATPPLSPAAGGAGAAAAAAVAAAMRPSTPSSSGGAGSGGGAHTPGVSPRPAAASNSEVSALINRILSTPTSGANTPTPGTPLGGLGSPKRTSGPPPAFAGFSSQSGSPHRGASTPTRVSGAAAGGSSSSSGGAGTLPVGVAPATAAAAAAAAAAAMAGSPKSSNSNTWRPFGTSASAPVTPLSGAVGLLTPEPAAAGDPKKPGPWVPAHRLAHMANSSGAVSDAEVGSSSSGGALMGSLGRPPRHRRSSGVESDGYARSDGGDSSDGGMGGARRSVAHRSGRSLQSTIEAIREASCELDPAVAAKAIATLSGTASAAAAADDAGEEGSGSRRRQRRRSSSTARAAAAAASVAMGSTSGEQGSAAGAAGGSGEGEPQQRSGRQRRRSTGSRRQSLDLQGPPSRAGAASPEDGKKHGSSKGSGAGGGGSSGGEDSKHKGKQKKDYAAWAAATVEFRQEASRASAGGGGSSGGAAGGSGNRAGLSPLRAAHAGEAHSESHARIARGPDGTRGFSMGRGRPLASPPPL